MRTFFICGCLLLALFAVEAAAKIHPRPKRYAIEGSFWGVRRVSYKFISPCSSLSFDQLHRLFKKAFAVWEERTGLEFQHTPHGDAHIEILFASGSHSDGEPFDGRGRILAHAFFPRYGGDIHFDDDELWSEDKDGPGLDLYAVAVHEIGHALGLKHSHEKMAIMAPFYHTYTGDKLHLHEDDLGAIDRLYGPSGAANRDRGVMHSTRETPPDICKNARLDAITQISNGSIYAFQGTFVWEISSKEKKKATRIRESWGIEGPIDAAMTNTKGNLYIFKGKDYFMFDRRAVLMNGYPKQIGKGLVDTPDGIGAATSWHEDGQPYFFKDGKYWKYSRWGMAAEWPRRVSDLIKGDKKVDAALYLRGTGVFLFAGDYYWQISGRRKHSKYPRSIAQDWFGCNRI